VHGNVYDEHDSVVRTLFGKWNEGLYCGIPPSAKCVWRPGNLLLIIRFSIPISNRSSANS
jgi:hypothetical protein